MREWLADARRARGLTQAAAAERAGIAQPTYCNIENGSRRPSVQTAKKIAEALGFDWTKFYE